MKFIIEENAFTITNQLVFPNTNLDEKQFLNFQEANPDWEIKMDHEGNISLVAKC